MRKTLIPICMASLFLLGGCVFAPSGSGHAQPRSEPAKQTTIGEELLDLDKALNAGIITQNEFERTKARILDGRN